CTVDGYAQAVWIPIRAIGWPGTGVVPSPIVRICPRPRSTQEVIFYVDTPCRWLRGGRCACRCLANCFGDRVDFKTRLVVDQLMASRQEAVVVATRRDGASEAIVANEPSVPRRGVPDNCSTGGA